jgi:hypothetical protein
MTKDEDFELFLESMGEASSRRPVPPQRIERYRNVFPGALLDFWQAEGWCGYADGRFWTVDPEDYRGVVEFWLRDTPFERIDNYHAFARTAFGTLYLWGERNQRRISVVCPLNSIVALKNEVTSRSINPDLAIKSLFAMMEPEHADMRGIDGELLFERVRGTLGPLAWDEVYGFEPALVLGGSPVVENVRKLRADVHLSILRQLAVPEVPF